MSNTQDLNSHTRVLMATVLASGTMGLLGRMVATAYPVLDQFFKASPTEIQWVMVAPILTASSVILLGGRLGDFIGKRRLFRLGLAVFALGSLISALSTYISILVVGQLLVGLGMALSAPACLSLIKQEISAEKQGESIGLWAGLSGAFGVLGLFVGGIIIEELGWQSVFYSTLPFLILAIAIIPKEKVNTAPSPVSSINWVAITGIFISIFLLVLSLIQGNANNWQSPWNWGSLVGSILVFTSVIIWQNRQTHAVIHLDIFKNRRILGANLGTFFIYFSLNGIYIFLVYHLQVYYNYSPTHAGWAMIPASLVVALFASRLGKWGQKKGSWKMLKVGTALSTLAFMGFLFPAEETHYFLHFLPQIALLGLGMALFVSPITSFALQVSQEHTGLASGINNFIARLSGILAIGVLGGIFDVQGGGLLQFQTCVWIMLGSSLLGTLFIWILVPSEELKKT